MGLKRKQEIENTYNPQHKLYKKLTHLFSGPIQDYQQEKARYRDRNDLMKYGIKTANGKTFKKLTKYNPFDMDYMANLIAMNRLQRYVEYDNMEMTPELSSGLDIYADEVCVSSGYTKVLTVKSPNQEIKSILNTLFYDVLNVAQELRPAVRSACKYGDHFKYLDIDERKGVVHWIDLKANEIERLEGQDENNPDYVRFVWAETGMTFERWQVAHFRLLDRSDYAPYGTSVLDSARKSWRTYIMVEEAMMAHRFSKAIDRRVYTIPIDGISPEHEEAYIENVASGIKRNRIVDPTTGQVDLRYNPVSIEEDIFLAERGGKSIKIENLPGTNYNGVIDDVKYQQDKMFTSIKIPRSYLAQSESGEDKQSLSQKDVQFAKRVRAIQDSIIDELESIARVHLYVLGYRGKDLLNFELKLGSPSQIAEIQELQMMKDKLETSSRMKEFGFPDTWIKKFIWGFSDDEIKEMTLDKFYDQKLQAQLDVIGAEEENLGDMGGGGPIGDIAQIPGAEGPKGVPEMEAPEGDDADSMLLASPDASGADSEPSEGTSEPGYRDVSTRLTPGAKGKWYKPVAADMRRSGANKRSIDFSLGKNAHGGSLRSIFGDNGFIGSRESTEIPQELLILIERRTNSDHVDEIRSREINDNLDNLFKTLNENKEDFNNVSRRMREFKKNEGKGK